MSEVLSSCPVCATPLTVTRLQCAGCGTGIDGAFELCPFCRMGAEQREFALSFLRCRGNIKEVERLLGISYPTVRGKLDELLRVIGEVEAPSSPPPDRLQVLQDLRAGRITQEEALERLK